MELTGATNPDWIAAIHEAGHAVAACKCGFELKDVTISGAYRCRTALDLSEEAPSTGISAPSKEEIERDAVYTLAGGKAEALRPSGDGTETLAASDREHFVKLGCDVVDKIDLENWRREMEFAAEDLVARNWERIERVAYELMKRGRLSGAQVRRIVCG